MTRWTLEGSGATLRRLRPSDAAALGRILRDREVTRTLPVHVRRETGEQWARRVLARERKGDGATFVIIPPGSTEAIGQVRLFNRMVTEQRAELGYWLRRDHWGQGVATEAARWACAFGFRSMALHRIEAAVVTGNPASRRVLEKLGFRYEGVSRQAARDSGGWSDAWRFGLLRGELAHPPEKPPRK
jgi:ribosomal-protein-alanine N-acetyltransferase